MSDATNAEVNQAVVRLDGSWRGVVVGVAEGLVTVQCQDAALRQFPAHEFFCEWRRLGSEREEGYRDGVESAAVYIERLVVLRKMWSGSDLTRIAASIRKLAEGK